MAHIDIGGRRIGFHDHGSGAQTVVFSHGYLMRSEMFADQIETLSAQFRVIAFDHRGHGISDAAPGPITMQDLVEDAIAVLEHIGGGPVHFAGMSTGGFVGLRVMVQRPDLIRSLTLIDTSAGAEPPAALRKNKLLLWLAGLLGLRPLLGQITAVMFGPVFRKDPARAAELGTWKRYIASLDLASARAFGKAIFLRGSVLDELRALKNTAPTLIIVGEDDVATPPHDAEAMHAAIEGSKLLRIANAGHSTPIETPDQVTRAMMQFLKSF